ncbi:MAG: hypothetical protein GY756_01485 [bacterium]|nr:hypothetical protein [bacterium]
MGKLSIIFDKILKENPDLNIIIGEEHSTNAGLLFAKYYIDLPINRFKKINIFLESYPYKGRPLRYYEFNNLYDENGEAITRNEYSFIRRFLMKENIYIYGLETIATRPFVNYTGCTSFQTVKTRLKKTFSNNQFLETAELLYGNGSEEEFRQAREWVDKQFITQKRAGSQINSCYSDIVEKHSNGYLNIIIVGSLHIFGHEKSEISNESEKTKGIIDLLKNKDSYMVIDCGDEWDNINTKINFAKIKMNEFERIKHNRPCSKFYQETSVTNSKTCSGKVQQQYDSLSTNIYYYVSNSNSAVQYLTDATLAVPYKLKYYTEYLYNSCFNSQRKKND